MCERERLIHMGRRRCKGPNQVYIITQLYDTGRVEIECSFFDENGNCTLMKRVNPNYRCTELGKDVQKAGSTFRRLEPLPLSTPEEEKFFAAILKATSIDE